MNKWLVIYDIKNPKRLNRVAKKIKDYGTRVQKSVFEVEAPESIIHQLREKIKKIIEEEDFIVYFSICEKDWQKRQKYGPQEFTEEEKEYYIY